jgi:aminopeptidase
VTLARFRHAPADSFEAFPLWQRDALLAAAARGDAFIEIRASDPELLKDEAPERVAAAERVKRQAMRPFSEYTMSSKVAWTLVSAPVSGWAERVFGGQDGQDEKLWDAIFKAVRADLDDPVAAWREHLANLEARRAVLNERRYAALHYRAPGTDLSVGLAEGHLWLGGNQDTLSGVTYVANLPTEEVFTMPHRARVDGVVSSSLPLSYSGVLIEGIRLEFEGGQVVKAQAERGEDTLKKLLDTDEGARRLGEVALVPHSSPISQSGILFYNTLYDENASSHLALGRAYRFTMKEGDSLSDEDAAARGWNDSLVHVDFMIGSSDMDIDGVTATGEREPVMRGGEWAL